MTNAMAGAGKDDGRNAGLESSPGTAHRAEILNVPEAFEEIKDGWQELSLAAARPSCFATPSYFQAWRDSQCDDVEPALLVTRAAGALTGVMPMMRARVARGPTGVPRHDFAPSDRILLAAGRPRPLRLRQLSTAVSMPATLIGPAPLCRAHDRAAVVGAMSRAIAGLRGWDVLAIPVMRDTEQAVWLSGLRGAGLSPWVLELDRHIGSLANVVPFAEILARQRRKYRQNIRRARAAATQLGVEITVHEGPAAVAQLGALETVARASWKQRGRAGAELNVPYAGRQSQFIETLLSNPSADAEITPVLAIARCEGTPIAVLLSLRHADRLTALVTFRTDQAARASPGLLLLTRMIDWAAAHGIKGYDWNVTQTWARQLTDETRAQNIIACFAPTLRGRFFATVSRISRALK